MNTVYRRRYSTNGNTFKGLFSSLGVTISSDGDLTISRTFMGIATDIYRGSILDVVSMDHVSANTFEQVYFHAKIGFKDGQSYELPLPTIELSTPGIFEELRNRIGLTGEYAVVEGKLPRWGRLTTAAIATS